MAVSAARLAKNMYKGKIKTLYAYEVPVVVCSRNVETLVTHLLWTCARRYFRKNRFLAVQNETGP
jgi:hypothetical protein